MKPNRINTSLKESHPIHSSSTSPCGTSLSELRSSTYARFRFQAARTTLSLAIFALYLGFATKANCQEDPNVWIGYNYSGTQGVDGEIENYISDMDLIEKPRGILSHSLVFLPTNKGAAVYCRHGYLRATASASGFHSGDGSMPLITTDSGGNAQAGFSDNLTIRGAGNTALPQEILVRMHWRVSGTLLFINHTPTLYGSAYGNAAYECEVLGLGGLFVGGSRGLSISDDPLVNSGSLPNHMLVDEETFLKSADHTVVIPLSANLSVHAVANYQSSERSHGEANAAVTLELLYIEVMDPANNRHLSVSVTAESGHSYPVVQPPVPGIGFGTTSFALGRDTGSGFFSFSSPTSGNFRVLGGNDFANMGSWQELAVVAGIPGVNAVNFDDPDSITQPSRFFVIQKLGD